LLLEKPFHTINDEGSEKLAFLVDRIINQKMTRALN
jgi:hypothetical protein